MSAIAISTINHEQPFFMSNVDFKSRVYPKWVYEKAGFTCRYHFFRKDEYIFNGVKYDQADANRLMEMMGWDIRESRLYGENGLIIHMTDIYHHGRIVSR